MNIYIYISKLVKTLKYIFFYTNLELCLDNSFTEKKKLFKKHSLSWARGWWVEFQKIGSNRELPLSNCDPHEFQNKKNTVGWH